VPLSRKASSSVKVTSDANVASPPAAGVSVPVRPPGPTAEVMVELGAVVAARRTFPSGPAGVAYPSNRIA
jgi:hypothetical protein